MPAIVTHHLFGQEAYTLLPDGVINNAEERLAFLLGNQGPDPLFARTLTLPSFAHSCHWLGHLMHEWRVAEHFLALRQGVERLPRADKEIGRAFVLGLLAHYTLDSHAHPFVYAQQYGLIDAAKDIGIDLAKSDGEVHAVIESDIDSWLLWTQRHQTIRDMSPVHALARTERIDRVSSALMSSMAMQVYAIEISPLEFAACVRDYERVFHLVDEGHPAKDVLIYAEQALRGDSILDALSHKIVRSDACPAANLEHASWIDPADKRERHESFMDIFEMALDAWPTIAEGFVKAADKSPYDLQLILGPRNYNGIFLKDVTEPIA